jgi:hypothetical protein
MRYLEATFPSSRFNSRVVPVALLLPSRCASSCWYSVVPIDKMSSRPIPVACHVQCLHADSKEKPAVTAGLEPCGGSITLEIVTFILHCWMGGGESKILRPLSR